MDQNQEIDFSMHQRDADLYNIVGSGTVLNIIRNRKQGTALHLVVRNGEVSLLYKRCTCFCITLYVINITVNNVLLFELDVPVCAMCR
jgi:hypothetical protein